MKAGREIKQEVEHGAQAVVHGTEHAVKATTHAAKQAEQGTKAFLHQAKTEFVDDIHRLSQTMKHDVSVIQQKEQQAEHQLGQTIQHAKQQAKVTGQQVRSAYQSVAKTVSQSVDTAKEGYDGAKEAMISDMTWGLAQKGPTPTEHPFARKTGELLGHLVATALGGTEFAGGATAEGGGLVLDAGLITAPIGVSVGVAGVAGIVHGSGAVVQGTKNTLQSAKDLVHLIQGEGKGSAGKVGAEGAGKQKDLSGIIERVKEIRSQLPSKLKKSGNFGYAEVDIQGINKKEYFAHSSVNHSTDKGAIPGISLKPEGEPVFKAKKVDPDNARIDTPEAYLRDYDTEYKILNDISSQLKNNKNAKGTVNLFTERLTCQSCTDVIMDFRREHPNIKVNILTNDGKVVK
ncbi:hypothetical protein COLO4_03238 [Corchorus olitorius]|uniref:Uncharacterized protein n=1 Tax=Corchorus olitorius TaxID=93759 RepID=A0A1R3KZE9_9ROSI|nr:hypothetical protein COLO4_03238 [Corchorus olitorius]